MGHNTPESKGLSTRLSGLLVVVQCLLMAFVSFPALAQTTPLGSPELLTSLEMKSQPSDRALDKVHVRSHRVPYAPGRSLFVTEYFTLRSVLREPARAVLFLTGPEFSGDFWSIPVEGYNGPEMAAKRGFFAYTFDYVGVGKSYTPDDGSQLNYLTQVAPVRTLIDRIRQSRRVKQVDLVGEGLGGEVASELADEPERVRSVVLSVMVYRTFDPGILPFYSPAFEDFLRSQPNGYWQPNFLDLTLAFSPNEDLRTYVYATQQDTYPTGPALQFWDFGYPLINATAAQVPALVIAGEYDPFPAAGDLAELAADWGGGADLVVIKGAHHVPRIEGEEVASQFFDRLINFLDP